MRRAVLIGVSALFVSPIGLALIVVLFERRPFRIEDQYLSFLIGDVLLGVAVGVGFSVAGGRPIWSWWLLLPIALGLLFGWWQLNAELASGVYTIGQAYSPSKLWHQFVVYPLLGALVTRALMLSWGHWRVMLAAVSLVLGWASLNAWDSTHPKNPHADYVWSATRSSR